VGQDLLRGARREIALLGLVEMNQNGPHFTGPELACPLAFERSCGEEPLLPGGGKGLPKIIDPTKQVE
jgi:hypothetical protein